MELIVYISYRSGMPDPVFNIWTLYIISINSV